MLIFAKSSFIRLKGTITQDSDENNTNKARHTNSTNTLNGLYTVFGLTVFIT